MAEPQDPPLKTFHISLRVVNIYTYAVEAESSKAAEEKLQEELASDNPPEEFDFSEEGWELFRIEEVDPPHGFHTNFYCGNCGHLDNSMERTAGLCPKCGADNWKEKQEHVN